MKHLLILSLLSLGCASFSLTDLNANSNIKKAISVSSDAIDTKVFKLKFNSKIDSNKSLVKIKNADGILHYYVEGQKGNLLVIIAEPWLTQEGLLNIVKPTIDAEFKVIEAKLQTLDDGYLSK